MIGNVTEKAVSHQGFAVTGVEGVYALAQCWRTISKKGCKECLEEAGKNLRGCLPGKQSRAMLAGCYFRYSTERFYDIEQEEEENHFGEAHINIHLELKLFLVRSLIEF